MFVLKTYINILIFSDLIKHESICRNPNDMLSYVLELLLHSLKLYYRTIYNIFCIYYSSLTLVRLALELSMTANEYLKLEI